MIRKYTFIDENGRSSSYTYNLPMPFYTNVEKELETQFGEDLTPVVLIDHTNRIIRLHSKYDTGKGTMIIPYHKKDLRLPLDTSHIKSVDVSHLSYETHFLELVSKGEKLKSIALTRKKHPNWSLRDCVEHYHDSKTNLL